MSFNPFDIEYEKLKSEISERNLKVREIQEKISWYDTFDILILKSNLAKTADSIVSCSELICEAKIRILNFKNELASLDSKLKSRLNPLNFFSSEQNTLRKKKSILLDEIDKTKKKQENCMTKYKRLIDDQKQMELVQKDYRKFDKLASFEMEKDLLNEIYELELKFNVISNKKEAVDIELKPIMEQICYYRNEIKRIERIVKKAEDYEYELNIATNSYERKMIHNECEDNLGDSRPQNIINNGKREINRNNRDLKKAEDRAITIGLKASRIIKKIIIDGNNMCYSGNILLGIEPLKCIINELSKKYEIVLVFDANINETLKITNVYLESIFKEIEFHIVQPGIPADEIIIYIANNDVMCYILSNDRFGDYRDKEVVKNGRIINHEILNNKVLIPDLGVSIEY